jgi:hypothetical protein
MLVYQVGHNSMVVWDRVVLRFSHIDLSSGDKLFVYRCVFLSLFLFCLSLSSHSASCPLTFHTLTAQNQWRRKDRVPPFSDNIWFSAAGGETPIVRSVFRLLALYFEIFRSVLPDYVLWLWWPRP